MDRTKTKEIFQSQEGRLRLLLEIVPMVEMSTSSFFKQPITESNQDKSEEQENLCEEQSSSAAESVEDGNRNEAGEQPEGVDEMVDSDKD